MRGGDGVARVARNDSISSGTVRWQACRPQAQLETKGKNDGLGSPAATSGRAATAATKSVVNICAR